MEKLIQENAELHAKMEGNEINYQKRIEEIELEKETSLDIKLAEFWDSAQDNERRLLTELHDLDEKLKSSERMILNLKAEIEIQSSSFQKERLEMSQTDAALRGKIKEREANESRLSEELRDLRQKFAAISDEFNQKNQEYMSLRNQLNDCLKQNLCLKNELIEKEVKIKKIADLYETIQKKEPEPKLIQISPCRHKASRMLESESSQLDSISEKKDENTGKAGNLLIVSPQMMIRRKSKNIDSSGIKEENKERFTISNFDDLESHSQSGSESPNEEEVNVPPEDLSKNEDFNRVKRENVRLFSENRVILEKNELLMLFLREKEDEITNLSDKVRKFQEISGNFEKEISSLRQELRNNLEKANRNRQNTVKSPSFEDKEQKIKDLERSLVETKEKWGNLVNFLNEELSLAEKTAVEAKVKFVEEATQKEFYMYKYNDLLSKVKRSNVKLK